MLMFSNLKTMPAVMRKPVNCSITHKLKKSAVKALNTFAWLQDQMDRFAWKEECNIQCISREIAEERAKLLRDLHLQQQDGIERPADDEVYNELLVEKTAWLGCSIGELLANKASIHALAKQIHEAEARTHITVEKPIRKLAQAFLKLFGGLEKIDALAGYESGEISAPSLEWADEVILRHAEVMEFLRLFDSRCAAEKPMPPKHEGPTHAVIIEDLNTIQVDGSPLKFSSARKAALFSFAVLGCENVQVEEFAKHYNDHLHRNPGTVANYANIFQQALKGLRGSLPFIVVTRPEPHMRSILGLELTSNVDLNDLTEWLHGRTSD